ncbi:hypothetical protein KJZ63_02115 [Patescibacteria group bacterium]|nr:hypothetical protein [Patescibacteria group bacterium]
MKTKTFATIVLAIGFLSAGFFAFNNYIYDQKQQPNSDATTPYRGTLSGEFVCLPHKDQTGPQTEECAFGIKTEASEYYAVDFSLSSQEMPTFRAGDKFSATGLITPIENLSTNQWQRYPIEGIFSITDSVNILEVSPSP